MADTSQTDDIKVTESEIARFKPEEQFKFDEEEVTLNKGMDMIVALDNLPQVDDTKREKLSTVIQKLILKLAPDSKIISFSMPFGPKLTKGFAFAEFATPEQAKACMKALQHYQIDKTHNIKVTNFADFAKYEQFDESSVEEHKSKPFKERETLRTWLTDKAARDQYAFRYWSTVEIAWNDPTTKMESVIQKTTWVDSKNEDRIAWSPLGSYLVTWVKKGIALHGGVEFSVQGAFNHKQVHSLDFSPGERFLVTANDDKENNVIIWDTRTATKLHTFTVSPLELQQTQWPMFKWSHDEKYYARLAENCIHVFDSATHKLLNKEPLSIPGIQSFSWSPTANIILYWVPGKDPIPAKIAMMDIPSRREVSYKSVYGVTNVYAYWSKSGKYVAVQVERKGAKKQDVTTFEIFRMQKKNIPVETVDVSENVLDFAWEPNGDMFCVIHSNDPAKRNVSFYTVGPDSTKRQKTFNDRVVDHCLWAPRGQFLVMTNTKTSTGILEFWNAYELDMIGYGEHFMMTDMAWDPTGRYLCTSVSYYGRQNENGFIMWNFLGRMLHQQRNDKFWQFLWRPRPPSLLTPKQEAKIQKQMAEKKKQFQTEDRIAMQKAHQELIKARKQTWNDFQDFKKRCAQDYADERAERVSLRHGVESDNEDDWEVHTEEVEEVISRKEEIVDA